MAHPTLSALVLAEQADPAFIAARVALLDQLADEWGTADDVPRPAGVGKVTVNEWAALCIATQRDYAFQQPVAQFVLIQPWLQQWVLHRLRLSQYIGRTLGLAWPRQP